jgi:aspartyl-tRNA(Asn)/glutamyl-tRNA(Gln) amidotransferase subunit A
MKGYTATYDATVIARLRAAGAIFAGRTNMDEFAMGTTTETSAFKKTDNPAAPGYVPGGSSGGSAAAVAGGIALAALGTDTGGSIRQPAAFCGCVGLKPTYGRVSRYGAAAYASSLDQIGPITRNVGDAAALLEVMAGHDKFDATSLSHPVPDYLFMLTGDHGGDLKGLRLGLPKEYFAGNVHADLKQRVRAAAAACRKAGAEIVEVSLPHTEYAVAVYHILANGEASAALARFDGIRYGTRAKGVNNLGDLYVETRSQGLGDEVKRRIILGTFVLSSAAYESHYVRAQKVRTLIRNDFDKVFDRCDALLTPVTPQPPERLGEKHTDPVEAYAGGMFVIPVNMAGICGLAVPYGTISDGRPASVQIIAPALGEATAFRIGRALELSQQVCK